MKQYQAPTKRPFIKEKNNTYNKTRHLAKEGICNAFRKTKGNYPDQFPCTRETFST